MREKDGILYEVRKLRTGDHIIKILIARPKTEPANSGKRPMCLWIHGGGYFLGMPEMIFRSRAADLIKEHGMVVVSPAYTLAPLAKYPTQLHECYDSLLWMRNHNRELNGDINQICIGGESAGGGLCAALSLYARDKRQVNIAFQMPLYPMIDDRDTESSRDNHGKVWNTNRNHLGWKLYLGKLYGREVISPYAAAARAKDFTGLPPTYTFVGAEEAFYAETVKYIENLKEAEVPAEIKIYNNWYHAFDMLKPEEPASKWAKMEFNQWVRYALQHYRAVNTDGSHNYRA